MSDTFRHIPRDESILLHVPLMKQDGLSSCYKILCEDTLSIKLIENAMVPLPLEIHSSLMDT